MTAVLRMYGIAYRTGTAKPPTTAHIHVNGSERALCGVGPVLFAGDTKAPDVDFETARRCKRCWLRAGPETTSLWDDPEPPRY